MLVYNFLLNKILLIIMTDVQIKTPNLDDIFEKWKNSASRKNKKKLEKEYGTKGAVFSLNVISAAESVKDSLKEAAIYFTIRKTVAPSKDKDENLVLAPRLGKETFYLFKGNVIKDNWKGKESVPMFDSISAVSCKNCRGKGYTEEKCGTCKGSGKIQENWTILVGEEQDKQKKSFSYPCGTCYGTGKSQTRCKECGGHQNMYKYEILPVPFKSVVIGVPVLHSSAQTKYEKEIEKDLHDLIENVEGIRFSDFKTLENKAEASLGYWNKNIKKTIGNAKSDYQKYDKDKDTKINSQPHLFPMIQLFCETKRGSKFEIYSIGNAQKFIIYSSF